MHIQENIQLEEYTTFKIGGPARYFCIAKNEEDIHVALRFVSEKNIPIFILAGGSNLIVSDAGFNGLVVKVDMQDIMFNGCHVTAGAGAVLNELVDQTIQKDLSGLEWAGGLPGTVGGAIRGNAGAYTGEMKDSVVSVSSITHDGLPKNRTNEECEFGYRSSIFKKSQEIILSAVFNLKKAKSKSIGEIAEGHRQDRKNKHPLEYPNTGSIFKNVLVQDIPQDVLPLFKDVQKNDPFPVIPTAKILSDAGLKGYKLGGAEISNKHPNFIVNSNNATANDVINVIEHAIATVMEKYKIKLEVEPQLLGFDTKFDWESE